MQQAVGIIQSEQMIADQIRANQAGLAQGALNAALTKKPVNPCTRTGVYGMPLEMISERVSRKQRSREVGRSGGCGGTQGAAGVG